MIFTLNWKTIKLNVQDKQKKIAVLFVRGGGEMGDERDSSNGLHDFIISPWNPTFSLSG